MSGVKGKQRENTGFQKETGFFEGRVLAINPDKEKLEKILGTQIEKEPEYVGEDENDNAKVNIVVWLQVQKSEKVKSVRFFLRDVERKTQVKEGEQKKPKKQYINNIGATTWAEDESKLLDWFKERPYRVAKEGEEELYNFIINWLNKLDLKDAQAALDFDWKKLMRGNAKEISEQIGGEYEGTVVCLSTIRTVKKEGEEDKEYEQVYNRAFLPGYDGQTMAQIRLKKIDDRFIESAKKLDRKKRSKLQKFVLDVTDGQYGIKDYFTLGELEPYDPTKNMVSGSKAKIEDDDASY